MNLYSPMRDDGLDLLLNIIRYSFPTFKKLLKSELGNSILEDTSTGLLNDHVQILNSVQSQMRLFNHIVAARVDLNGNIIFILTCVTFRH